jgi:hypothetical protein
MSGAMLEKTRSLFEKRLASNLQNRSILFFTGEPYLLLLFSLDVSDLETIPVGSS